MPTLPLKAFRFLNGAVRDVEVAYKSINASAHRKALIPTCYGGRIGNTLTFTEADAAALADYHVIVVAMLGNGESSSPSNHPDFPESLDYQDQIRAQYALAQHLGVESLDVVVGFSMGGQQAYYWAAMYPDFVKSAVCICGSARTSFHNYAFLEGPVSALTCSADFRDGTWRSTGQKPLMGLKSFGRAYTAWLYSAEWFRQELWRGDDVTTIAEFMAKHEDMVIDWNADDLIILARQWQAGDIGKVGGGYEKTLGEVIKARMLVMPGSTDQYFRYEDSEEEVKLLQRGELAVVPSVWGHAAGGGANLPDTVWMNERLSKFLNSA